MTLNSEEPLVERLIPLSSNEGDSPGFVDIATRLITAAAVQYDTPIVYAIHVDNWFGARWLGFRGKLCGIAGVHSRTLRRDLALPPFHPNRILGGAEYHRADDGHYRFAGSLNHLHRNQRSEVNLGRRIRRNTLHAWYSGNTATTNKGVLMTYISSNDITKAWYVMFDGHDDWRLDQHVGITRSEVGVLLGVPIRDEAV